MEQYMSSSGEAFTFFKEWMDSKRNLLVMATFGDVAVSGVGRIETFNGKRLTNTPVRAIVSVLK
jgi:hypothetical protein